MAKSPLARTNVCNNVLNPPINSGDLDDGRNAGIISNEWSALIVLWKCQTSASFAPAADARFLLLKH